MQVVFVHGVNTRKTSDGSYERQVAVRTDRLNRLAFAGHATIRNPYWGSFGRPGPSLGTVPTRRGEFDSLAIGETLPVSRNTAAFVAAGNDLREIVGTLSARAMENATFHCAEAKRHEVEDYWMAAAEFAEMRPSPHWMKRATSINDVAIALEAEVEALRATRSLGGGWSDHLPAFDANDFAASRFRDWSSGFLAQFLGDALMFFSRRAAGRDVRREIAASVVDAAKVAKAGRHALILIGHSMGGSILHDMLTDPDEVNAIEEELGHALKLDLFLSVGTQIGLFSEMGQFTTGIAGRPLSVACKHYWNVFDFADTLAFLCAPVILGAVDLEVNTAGGILRSHGAYFDNALLFSRLRARLLEAELSL